ncbi:MAG: hypothetical protein V4506_09985 [Bacteroidota bacterium]
MKLSIRLIIASAIFLFSCNEAPKELPQAVTIKYIDTLNAINDMVESIGDNNDGGPPFSDSCSCTFNTLAHIKSGNTLDLVLSGKGWNPNAYSCSWTWGEIIHNEFPDDPTIEEFRIHLLDLDSIHQKSDVPFLQSKEFKQNLIATYSKSEGQTSYTCKFDPNKIGKYPKPKQWRE